MERLISSEKLRAWVERSTTLEQRRCRWRWAYGYMTGASFATMNEWAKCKAVIT